MTINELKQRIEESAMLRGGLTDTQKAVVHLCKETEYMKKQMKHLQLAINELVRDLEGFIKELEKF